MEFDMKAAAAYERRGKFILHSSSKTTDGVWISSSPYLLHEGRVPGEIGALVKKCLSGSQSKVPHPAEFKTLFAEALTLAKVKSHKEFMRGALCVEIEQIGDNIRFVPTKNLGPDEGFSHDGNMVTIDLSADDSSIGAALLEAFSRCE
jgi:hypothetical protein